MRFIPAFALPFCLIASIAFASTLEDGKGAYDLGDYKLAWELLKPLAANGNAEAQLWVGWMYKNGQGTKRDCDEAVKWYRQSEKQDNVVAQVEIGMLYDRGECVTKDKAEGFKWLFKAAQRGNAKAQMMVGWDYEHGSGVTQDLSEAYFWYCEADLKLLEKTQRNELKARLTSKQITSVERRLKDWSPKGSSEVLNK